LCLYPSRYSFYVELSIPISCVPTSASISKSVIISGSSPTGRLWALCGSAANVMFAALNLILDCPGLELAIAVHRGLSIGRPLPCVPCDLCVPMRSSDVARRRFWPVKAWDGWLSPPMLKVGNAGKAPASPWLIACYFYSSNLACSYSRSC